MKIYLDNCALQRPLDDKSQIRIRLEAEAILSVIGILETHNFELVTSEALEFELEQTPRKARIAYGRSVLENADLRVEINEGIEKQARNFVNSGIKPMDALHLASAEVANVDYFCTCDDRFLKRARKINKLSFEIVTPLELIELLSK